MQPELNHCLLQLVDAVPDEFDLGPPRETAHRGMRSVAFRDLLEYARRDITQSLEELTSGSWSTRKTLPQSSQWLSTSMQLIPKCRMGS